jgi:hypothetical protein
MPAFTSPESIEETFLGPRLTVRTDDDELTEEELIDFWADDLSPASGRHAVRSRPAALRAA